MIRKLVDIASKNGNFLLNVGPTAEGLIPEESVARLRAIGRWMKVNREAIYATKASPFTALNWGRCTLKDDGDSTILYLHVFDWPADGTLVVPGIGNDAQQAYLLAARRGNLRVERTGTDLRIHLPQHAPDAICSVVALKVQGRPVIYEAPQIVATSDRLVQSLAVKLTTRSQDLVIRYTLDGSDPTSASPRYAQPIRLTQTTTVKACAFYQDKPVSSATAKTFTQVEALPAVTVAHVAAGLHPISIEYFNKTGGGSLSLHWSAADQPLEPVPQAVLKHAD